jgi:hypothetical protein
VIVIAGVEAGGLKDQDLGKDGGFPGVMLVAKVSKQGNRRYAWR